MQRRCILNKRTKKCRTTIKRRRTTRSRRVPRRERRRGGSLNNNSNISVNIPQNDSVRSIQSMDFDDISDEELAREIENSLPSFISRTATPMSRISNHSNLDRNLSSSMASEGETDAEIDDSILLNITPMDHNESIPYSLNNSPTDQSSFASEMNLDGGRRHRKHTMHRRSKQMRRKTKKHKRT